MRNENWSMKITIWGGLAVAYMVTFDQANGSELMYKQSKYVIKYCRDCYKIQNRCCFVEREYCRDFFTITVNCAEKYSK